MSVWDEVDTLLGTYDASVRFDSATGCMWGGELRLTLTDPPNAPSRSMAFYKSGAMDPAQAARELLDDAESWLKESGLEPVRVPDQAPGEDG